MNEPDPDTPTSGEGPSITFATYEELLTELKRRSTNLIAFGEYQDGSRQRWAQVISGNPSHLFGIAQIHVIPSIMARASGAAQ